jgi:cobalt-zinc-cadmium efflux system outer membrane protein
VLCLVLLAAGTPGAPPARAAPAAEGLTLAEAIRQALENNPAVRRAAARIRERRGQALHAGRLVPANPELGLEVARRTLPDAESGDRAVRAVDELRAEGTSGLRRAFGRSLLDAALSDPPDRRSTDIGIRVSQELWTADKRALQRGAAALRTAAAQGELDFLRTSVAARTRRAFLGALLADESARTAKRVVALTEDLERYARRRLEAGEVTALEVNVAAIGVGRARAELALARRDRILRRLELAELLGLDPVGELDLRGVIRPAELDLPDEATLLQAAGERRRDLAAAAQEVVAARKELRLAERQLIPNLTVMGFYEREESADIVGVGVSLPLPLLHRFGGEQEAASARLTEARIERDALHLQVRREVREAVADYRAASERVRLLSMEMLGAAEENLHLTRAAFEAGKVGAPAIATAQDNLLRVRRSHLEALSELIAAATALEQATGGLVRMAQAEHPTP